MYFYRMPISFDLYCPNHIFIWLSIMKSKEKMSHSHHIMSKVHTIGMVNADMKLL